MNGGAERVRFNLSHTRGLVGCALTLDSAVGFDVEHSGGRGASLELAQRFFAPPEIAALEGLEAEALRSRFYETWTLKEAYLKARGLGLSLPLDGFGVHAGGLGRRDLEFFGLDDVSDRWWLHSLRPTSEHAAAVAVGVQDGEAENVIERWLEP